MSLWGAASDDIWVAGASGTLLHFDALPDVVIAAGDKASVQNMAAVHLLRTGPGGL